jgi:hypothetical protein
METFNPQSGHMADDSGPEMEGLGGPDELDLMGSGGGRKRVNDATLILLGTLLVGAGILMGMRWVAGRSGAMAIDKQVEQTVHEFLGRTTPTAGAAVGRGDSDRALSSLADDRTEAQVPLENVKKNPFVLQITRPEGGPVVDQAAELEALRERQRLEQRRQTLTREVERLRLSSIMGQPGRYVAVIANQVVQVGDFVADKYEVTQIDRFEVQLEAEGFTFVRSLRD